MNSIDDEIYVGSTIKTLSQRMAHHRMRLKQSPHIKLYAHMTELGIEHFYIELIENIPCNDVYELRAREGHFIREIGTLNMLISGRSNKEWYDDNREIILQQRESNKYYLNEYGKQYHEQNKEHIRHRKNERITCNVCGCHLNKGNIARHQKSNKCRNIMFTVSLEKIPCNICGCQIERSGISRHQKTKKCKSYVKPIENEE